MLTPLLFTVLTNDCANAEKSNYFMKFAADTIVVGNDFNYRSEGGGLLARDNNFSFTRGKNYDFRRSRIQHLPLTFNVAAVKRMRRT